MRMKRVFTSLCLIRAFCLAGSRKTVVALVPASRALTILALALAVPMVAVAIALANDKAMTAAVIGAVALAYAGIQLFLLRSGIADPLAPSAVSRAELPPVVTTRRQVALYGILLAVGYATITYWGLAQHPQSVASVGIALAAPAASWYQYRRARRTERELHGELYVTQFGWRKKNRPAYLVRSEPAA
jgi:hypothetical protein